MSKYWSSLPIVVLGSGIIYLLYFSACNGVFEIYSSLFIIIIILGYLAFYYLIQIIDSLQSGRNKMKYQPLLVLLLVSIVGYGIHQVQEHSESEIILKAHRSVKYEEDVLIHLQENGKLEIVYGYVEDRCSCLEVYTFKDDTLKMPELSEERQRMFNLSKVLVRSDQFLIPVVNNQIEADSSVFFKVYD
ncbi:hypothetical protein [Fulvivirga ligni]|uniref:hypothetical protein n=1 Tax=Fulvivirga ligni TaxID=2904246 RepID=UPI001F3EAD46|nr:hypothetical protein [Fulvivirga ligni]UII23771.1 hypothetical protein LVD16_11115 [Fulvivirga ligni]